MTFAHNSWTWLLEDNQAVNINNGLYIPGDPSYKIPPLDPLHVEEIRVDDGNPNSPAQLNLLCKNINISGLANSEILKANFDFPNKKIIVSIYVPVATALAKYSVTGKVLLLPIKGDGDCNITIVDLRMWYDIKYDMEKRKDGYEYAVIKDTLLNYNISRAHFQLDNLFNGDKLLVTSHNLFNGDKLSGELYTASIASYISQPDNLFIGVLSKKLAIISRGENVNMILNDNWEDTVKEIGPVLAESINAVFKQILVNVLDIVPFKNIFPEVV
uniref:Uncharacterized protein n=1 Tax=Timema tahoe TaxID=61484 RepID=A0A7R9ING0_9NEOP|nr:unnamed protein product [Timema tahoe]